jgi:uncharacterized protein
MANSKPFLDAVEARASIFKITNESPIPDARIHEIVNFAIKHCPSSWNVQSARAVILLKGEHQKLWDIAAEVMVVAVPEEVYKAHIGPRVAGFRGGYGSVRAIETVALSQMSLLIGQGDVLRGPRQREGACGEKPHGRQCHPGM